MKKQKYLTMPLTIVGAALVLAGCKAPAAVVTKAEKNTLAVQSASALTLIKQESPMALGKINFAATPTVNKVEDLLPQFDTLLTNEDHFKVVELTSDRAEYENHQQIAFVDLTGSEVKYDLYFNILDDDKKAAPSATSATSDDDDDYDDQEFDDIDDDGQDDKFRMAGIAVYAEAEYNFYALSEVEVDDDETETELKFKMITGENSYIAIKQEIEIEVGEREEEFSYTVVENGNKTLEYKLELEIETDDDEIENELKVNFNGVEYKVDMRIVADKTYFDIIEGDDDNKVKSTYEKVVTIGDDGSETVSYNLVA